MKANCENFNCGKAFEPSRRTQVFCSKECRLKMQEWRSTRGSLLVTPLLQCDWDALKKIRSDLWAEIEEGMAHNGH